MSHKTQQENTCYQELGPITEVGEDGSQAAKKLRSSAKFIKGPIPFSWLQSASQSFGSGANVGIAIWFLVGVRKSRTVKISKEAIDLSGCTRQTFYKTLQQLEQIGLIAVRRKFGQRPTITILD
jgi:hypothetical protein